MARAQHDFGAELKKGSVQLCILAMLKSREKYGFEIMKELREVSGGFYDLKEGTLYPALKRMEKRGYLESEFRIREDNRPPRKYYNMTPLGHEALAAAWAEWDRMVDSCNKVLAVARDREAEAA